MNTVSKVSGALQLLLTDDADRLARHCGAVQRRRKFTGSTLAQTLVLGWLHRPDATLEQLAQTAAACGVAVCPQAVAQRFHEGTAMFFRRLLETAVAQVITAQPVATSLLGRFTGVYLEDSTLVSLPACFRPLWPGTDGKAGYTNAALKLHVQLDMKTGQLMGPRCAPGRQSDHHSHLSDALPPGAIRVADLGYFQLAELQQLDQRGVFWITRIQPHTALWDQQGRRLDLDREMSSTEDPLDLPIYVGTQTRVACRLICLRVPAEVVRKRRKRLEQQVKKRGRVVSERQRQWCRWTVLVTNLSADRLSVAEALVLVKIRWQIELLFKRWKSLGQIDSSRSKSPWRILVEVYAKLIAMVIQHWVLLVAAWKYEDRSLSKAALAVQDYALALLEGLSSRRCLAVRLRRLADVLRVAGRLNARRARPPSYQLLRHPNLLNDSTLT